MVFIIGEVRFGAGEIERLRPAMHASIEAARVEDGCLAYAYSVDILEPDVLRIAERWRDRAAADVHMRQNAIRSFMAAVRQAKVEALSVRLYDGETVVTLLGD